MQHEKKENFDDVAKELASKVKEQNKTKKTKGIDGGAKMVMGLAQKPGLIKFLAVTVIFFTVVGIVSTTIKLVELVSYLTQQF
jgi:hypothetical protein